MAASSLGPLSTGEMSESHKDDEMNIRNISPVREESLRELGLFSIERRRVRWNIFNVHKYLNKRFVEDGQILSSGDQ